MTVHMFSCGRITFIPTSCSSILLRDMSAPLWNGHWTRPGQVLTPHTWTWCRARQWKCHLFAYRENRTLQIWHWDKSLLQLDCAREPVVVSCTLVPNFIILFVFPKLLQINYTLVRNSQTVFQYSYIHWPQPPKQGPCPKQCLGRASWPRPQHYGQRDFQRLSGQAGYCWLSWLRPGYLTTAWEVPWNPVFKLYPDK